MKKGLATGLVFLAVVAVGLSLIVAFALGVALGGGDGFGPAVGVVRVQGEIKDADEIVERIHDLAKDDRVKAIVVRIDSPGGAVAPSQDIHAELRRAAASKKVVASLGAVAASGGFYAAVAADRIVAEPGTLTGSIGVISELPNVSEISQRFGFQMNVVKSGPAKDVGNPFRPFTPEDRSVLQAVVDDAYGQFVKAVAEGRKLPEEKVREIADGRVLTGERARSLGLVDDLGNLRDAIDAAARLGGIKGEPRVLWPPEPSGLRWKWLLSGATRAAVEGAAEGLAARSPAPLEYRLPGL